MFVVVENLKNIYRNLNSFFVCNDDNKIEKETKNKIKRWKSKILGERRENKRGRLSLKKEKKEEERNTIFWGKKTFYFGFGMEERRRKRKTRKEEKKNPKKEKKIKERENVGEKSECESRGRESKEKK